MYPVHLGYCAPHFSLLVKLNSLALCFPGILKEREKKLTNNYVRTKRSFKDVIYLFCCQGHLKHFLEKHRFCRIWELTHIVRGGVGVHVICIIMTHCIRNRCDSLLIGKIVSNDCHLF